MLYNKIFCCEFLQLGEDSNKVTGSWDSEPGPSLEASTDSVVDSVFQQWRHQNKGEDEDQNVFGTDRRDYNDI